MYIYKYKYLYLNTKLIIRTKITVKSSLTHPFELLHNCQGPDNRLGNCMDIRDCDEYLKKLISEPQNSQFTDFLRSSNKYCSGKGFSLGQAVCCPIGKATVSDIPNSPPLLQKGPERSGDLPEIDFSAIPPLLHRPPTQPPQSSKPLPVIPLEVKSHPSCGVSSQTTFRRFIGGEEAIKNTWPWVVAIGYYTAEGPQYTCSGTLITEKHILTAAQCVTTDMSFIRVGALDLQANGDGYNVPIEKGLVHGSFNPNTLQNDVALILLKEPVTFSDSVRPICLPISKELQEKDFTDYNPLTAGWKTNKRRVQALDTTLRQFQTLILSQNRCREMFSGIVNVDEKFLCAGQSLDEFYAGIGGSLMQPQQQGKDFVFHSLGILSYGEKTVNGKTLPGLYTRVSSYTDWIQSQIQNS